MTLLRTHGCEGRVAVLTLSDPGRRNALSLELSGQLAGAVAECDQDGSVHAIVITGAPPAFCAGADRGALAAAGRTGSEAQLRGIYAGFLAVANAALPTSAAVNGPAVGAGLNLALACDVRLAGPGAVFDARFLQLGIHPGGGMTWLAQRAVGPQTADRKSTRLNSSHANISYAVFCLKKKKLHTKRHNQITYMLNHNTKQRL